MFQNIFLNAVISNRLLTYPSNDIFLIESLRTVDFQTILVRARIELTRPRRQAFLTTSVPLDLLVLGCVNQWNCSLEYMDTTYKDITLIGSGPVVAGRTDNDITFLETL